MSMNDLPDAPWIREAETYGMPPYDEHDPVCPVCYHECETIYRYRGSNDVLGCEHCIEGMDAWDWQCDQDREVGL